VEVSNKLFRLPGESLRRSASVEGRIKAGLAAGSTLPCGRNGLCASRLGIGGETAEPADVLLSKLAPAADGTSDARRPGPSAVPPGLLKANASVSKKLVA